MLFPRVLLYSPQRTAALELSLPKPHQVPGSLHGLLLLQPWWLPSPLTPCSWGLLWRGTAPGFLTTLLGLWEAVPGIFSWVSCVLQAVKKEVQVLPGSHAAHCLVNRKLVLPFSSSLCFINCTDHRGGCQGSCHFPGGPSVQTQSFVPKRQGPFYTSLPSLQVAEYRTFPSERPGLPLPSPFLLTYPAPAQPTHRPRKALCFLNIPPSQKQTFTHSSQTHRQAGPEPLCLAEVPSPLTGHHL